MCKKHAEALAAYKREYFHEYHKTHYPAKREILIAKSKAYWAKNKDIINQKRKFKRKINNQKEV